MVLPPPRSSVAKTRKIPNSDHEEPPLYKLTPRKEVFQNETRKNIKYKKITEHSKERRLRRMPDFLPVCMQDKLHCRKPEL